MSTSAPPKSGTGVLAAWLALLLFVPCFLLAFLVGEGLIGLLGYDVGGSAVPPFWAGALATVPALVVFAVPLWPTWHFGRKARGRGARGAMIPFWIAAALVAVFTIQNTIPLGQ